MAVEGRRPEIPPCWRLFAGPAVCPPDVAHGLLPAQLDSKRRRPEELSMAMSISRLFVGNPDTEQGLRSVLDELGVPEGEDWTASISSSTANGAWEAMFDGAARSKCDHVEWE